MRIASSIVLLCIAFLAVSCTNTASIIGKWQDAANSDNEIEFLKDGTFVTADKVASTIGTYKYEDDKRVKIETPGVGGRSFGTSIFEVSISGDELSLKFESGSLGRTPGTIRQYKRIQ